MTSSTVYFPQTTTADAELARSVHHALIASRHSFGRIDVEADEGTIRLSGSLTSYFLRQCAVVEATRVEGVLRVIDDLNVEMNSLPTT